jgi:urea carboxylase
MLRVAADEPIDWARLAQAPQGAAIEVRIYAESPLKNFQPSPGVLTDVAFPDDVRIDTGVTTGSEVSAFYDPMIAKLIVHAPTRDAALAKLQSALAATRLHGIATNLDYLRQITASEAFVNGTAWTRMLDSVVATSPVIEVIQPGTWSSVQDYPAVRATGISACRRPGRWMILPSAWLTALSATMNRRPGWSLPCRGRCCSFTAMR